MAVKVLMIALNKAFVASLETTGRDYQVYLIEEKELYETNPNAYKKPIICGVRLSEYQQSEVFIDEAAEWHKEIKFDVVVPGMEYAVKGAYKLAQKLGLNIPGDKVGETFTDKYKLRNACKTIGIPQPRFIKVNGIDDIRHFYNGSPIIIKPANRRSSVGVVKIERLEDITSGWEESSRADEGNRTVSRDLKWGYLAEDYMDGYEVSVETLVYSGKAVFHNITYKDTIGGRYFAEVGHIVPAQISSEDKDKLLKAKELLIEGLNINAGLFHSEWKVTSEGPKLIECAARAPGDKIPDLIYEAYGFNLYTAFIDVLMGKVPKISNNNKFITSIRYFTPGSGKFVRVEGLKVLESLPQVINYNISVSQGQEIDIIKDSWSRVGFYMLKCTSIGELKETINKIEKEVRFIVE